jgi:SAM-dependent methyltransferase
MQIELRPTACAICGAYDNAAELYPANFDSSAFSPTVFSARRLPDRVHYRLVRCHSCGLVRSDPVADPEAVGSLYRQSSFDYSEETASLAETYGRYLARLQTHGINKGSLLEIGCGNGFFLEEARAQGYAEVRGIEPSRAAIELARPDIRPGIVCGIMGPGLFPERSFDAICFFQVLDHIFDPAEVVEECFRLLKPGGLVLCLNHNVEARSARWMRERSPIVDIEHTYLYSPRTIGLLFSKFGFHPLETGAVRNRYSISYLARLVPLPAAVKRSVLAVLQATRIGRIPLRLPLGNLYMIARKPR